MKLEKEVKQCLYCMENHEVQLTEEIEKTIFKGEEIEFKSKLYYCKNYKEYFETEELINENNMRIKDAYREKVGLLTGKDIKNIRHKYNLTQKELSKVLDWGEKTITRYETHQVQDRAHDEVLVCIKEDPLKLYKCANTNKELLGDKSYKKIIKEVRNHLDESKEILLRNSIIADYIDYSSSIYQGNTNFNIDKTIDVINYITIKSNNLFTVKLMKLMWYSDILNYKKYNKSITGLEYFKETMGALPKAYDRIISLEDIKKEIILINDSLCTKFIKNKKYKFKILETQEKETIDYVLKQIGELSTDEIISKMHQEEAYKKTEFKHPISYDYSKYIEL